VGAEGKTSGPSDRAAIPSSLGCFAFAFSHKMGKQRAAHATATQNAASDEEPQHAAFPASAFSASAFLIIIVAFVLVPVLATFAHEMGEERPAHAAPAQHPARDQKAQDLAMILVLGLVHVVVSVVVFVLVSLLAALAQEVRKKQAANAATTQQATRNQEFKDAMLLVASLLVVFAKIVAVLATPFTQ
jgi:uncharacterized membrane protein